MKISEMAKSKEAARVGKTRWPMERIYHIHEAVSEGRLPNCRTLAAELEVTPKTIQRDITFMRDRLGLPLEYDEQAHGYRYTGDVSTFPVFEVGASERDTTPPNRRCAVGAGHDPGCPPSITAVESESAALRGNAGAFSPLPLVPSAPDSPRPGDPPGQRPTVPTRSKRQSRHHRHPSASCGLRTRG